MQELTLCYDGVDEWVNSGNSLIVDPEGEVLAGPLYREEGIIYAEVSGKRLRDTKWKLDVVGHYDRPDVFSLSVQSSPNLIIRWNDRNNAEDEDVPTPEAND